MGNLAEQIITHRRYVNTGNEILRLDYDRPMKTLIVGDYHMRDKDFSTVKGYITVLEENIWNLIELKKKLKLDVIIINGDLADGGYQDDIIADSHKNLIAHLGEGLDLLALNIGNHFFIERDSNIELYLIQPHAIHHMKKPHFASEPILKTPRAIVINNKIQFSLFNYSKQDKMYVQPRERDVVHHIGLYHDEIVLPKSLQADMHMTTDVNSNYLKSIYRNIDEAICSHIHKPFGMQYLNIDGRVVPIYIPGSGSITEYSKVEVHNEVEWPLYTIEGRAIQRDLVRCNTGYDKLVFKESKTKEAKQYENLNIDYVSDAIKIIPPTSIDLRQKISLLSYLRDKGYTLNDLESVKLASERALDKTTEISLHLRKNVHKDEDFI